jgi:hypothetical protein
MYYSPRLMLLDSLACAKPSENVAPDGLTCLNLQYSNNGPFSKQRDSCPASFYPTLNGAQVGDLFMSRIHDGGKGYSPAIVGETYSVPIKQGSAIMNSSRVYGRPEKTAKRTP